MRKTGRQRNQKRRLGSLEIVGIDQILYGALSLEGRGNFAHCSVAACSVLSADVDVVALGVDVHAHFQGAHGTRLSDDSHLAGCLSESCDSVDVICEMRLPGAELF